MKSERLQAQRLAEDKFGQPDLGPGAAAAASSVGKSSKSRKLVFFTDELRRIGDERGSRRTSRARHSSGPEKEALLPMFSISKKPNDNHVTHEWTICGPKFLRLKTARFELANKFASIHPRERQIDRRKLLPKRTIKVRDPRPRNLAVLKRQTCQKHVVSWQF